MEVKSDGGGMSAVMDLNVCTTRAKEIQECLVKLSKQSRRKAAKVYS